MLAMCDEQTALQPWLLLAKRATTVLCVRKGPEVVPQPALILLIEATELRLLPHKQVVIMADGQVTRGNEVVKPNVKKVRRIADGNVISGFAGTVHY